MAGGSFRLGLGSLKRCLGSPLPLDLGPLGPPSDPGALNNYSSMTDRTEGRSWMSASSSSLELGVA